MQESEGELPVHWSHAPTSSAGRDRYGRHATAERWPGGEPTQCAGVARGAEGGRDGGDCDGTAGGLYDTADCGLEPAGRYAVNYIEWGDDAKAERRTG